MENTISVIIPTYNRSDLIAETIDSVLDQIYKPLEVIIVDDGSTDDTERVVSRYGGNVKYVKIKNSGVCTARNFGVSLARGDCIAFCDHDDLWLKDKLSWQAELLFGNTGVDYCFTNFRILGNGMCSEHTKFDEAPPGYWDIPKHWHTENAFVATEPFFSNVVRFQPIFPSTVTMKRDFFFRVGAFDESFGRMCSEDLEFTLRCTQECPTGIVTAPVVHIRKHDENFSHGRLPGISFILSDIDILEYSLKKHRLGPICRELINESIVQKYISVAYEAFRSTQFDLFNHALDNIPPGRRSAKFKLKAAIAGLPEPFARLVHTIVCSKLSRN
jgi:glycosyltransferase involved in cell wall biosynthesis